MHDVLFMDLSYFLYRRLSRWITCRMRLPFDTRLSLATKHDVASFQDVFCHPFYWQCYGWIREPPRLVVDCGANCGHFSILMDTCIRVKFGRSDTRYVLIEPNPALQSVLRRNLREAGLADRSSIIAGLLGEGSGNGTLWVQRKNFLASSLSPMKGAVPHSVPFVDLGTRIGGSMIDVLKVDIEGGEYSFVREDRHVLPITRLLLMEVHGAPKEEQTAMFERIEAAGLAPCNGTVAADGLLLRAWSRGSPTETRLHS